MNDFKREPKDLIASQIDKAEQVMRSGWWILGSQVKEFENRWSDYLNCSHTIGVANGMDALEIALRALNIGKNDEVITTSITAFATVLAIIRSGAIPVIADIDPDTAIISAESVERCITKKTKAIIVVHLYGQSAPMDKFLDLCDKNKIHLIEDCAQAHGAKYQNKNVGTFGVVSGWSFYPTKNLGAIGDGGAITTNDSEIADKAKCLRNYGQSVRYIHPYIGLNSRLDELQAAILIERLKYLDSWNARRKEIAEIYSQNISNDFVKVLPKNKDENSHVYHLFVVKSKMRDMLASYLKEKNIETLIHYPVPIHMQEPCKDFPQDPDGLKHALIHSQECLSIPCHPFLMQNEIEIIIDAINKFKV